MPLEAVGRRKEVLTVPIISQSEYRPPALFSNQHVQTIYPSVFRKVIGVDYKRERIDTPDGDFLDLDFSLAGHKNLAIVLHGLEGDSSRSYVLGMVKAFNTSGWDALAMNFRGCSGESNRKPRFYHSGDTADLQTVLSYVDSLGKYSQVALIGFSLGGNVILKYLGEQGEQVPAVIRGAVAISVPCDLASCSAQIGRRANRIYMKRFLRMLHDKIRMKMKVMPGLIDDHDFSSIRNFQDFDDRYTAPLHGFKNARDYWHKSSCKQFLSRIAVPALVINSADDPFLAEACYPLEEAKAGDYVFLEMPDAGGHVGFVTFNRSGKYWSESRAVSFINENT
jgi:uncharacterized protein